MQKKPPRPTGSGAGRDSVYVDTSAWIALLSARDQNHAVAEQLFREAVALKVVLMTTNLVLAEVHRLILHRVGMRAANLALDRIESSARTSILFATDAHHHAAKAWLLGLRGRRMTYTDAVGFAVLNDSSCAGFLSFDSDFLVAGFSPWTP